MPCADRVRFGDPMAHLARKKTQELAAPIVPAHMAKQMKKSGFIIPQASPQFYPTSPQLNWTLSLLGMVENLAVLANWFG